jgi:hypothetical protein
MKMRKVARITLGILFCIAGVILSYYAYKEWQNQMPYGSDLLQSLDDGALIIPLITVLIGSFTAVMLLVRDEYYKYPSIRLIARFISIFCILIGIIFTFMFLLFTIIGNDFSRSWSLSVVLGLVSAVQFFAYFIITRRVRQAPKLS